MIPRFSSRMFQLSSRRGRRGGRGAVLVAALVCMLIVMSLIGTMLRSALHNRRQLHVERDLRQAELLLQAGVERAVYRFATEGSYSGETWVLPASEIGGRNGARVTITPARALEQAHSDVRVVAEYPFGDHRSIRRSRTIVIQSSAAETQE